MITRISLFAIAALVSSSAQAGTIFSAAGVNAAAIQRAVDAFRAELGTLNAGVGPFAAGRREVNWDGVPDTFASPNAFPGDFFNQAAPAGRARGIEFGTLPGLGDELRVSANAGVGPVEFGDIDASYETAFQTFSSQRLFGVVGDGSLGASLSARFFVPGLAIPAATNGFGAVFTGVNLENTAGLIVLFKPIDELSVEENGDVVLNGTIGVDYEAHFAPIGAMSFVGVAFDDAVIHGVLIGSGSHSLSAGVVDNTASEVDPVAMDDFIYGEPIGVPEPATTALALAAVVGMLLLRRRR